LPTRFGNSLWQLALLRWDEVKNGHFIPYIVPEDDPRWKKCKEEMLIKPYLNFMKVRDVNDWWNWVNETVLPSVRVQNWYNGKPPYGLRGYLDDRVNRIIGYAIIRQTRERTMSCK
jgi:hypothetical protein